MRLLLLLCVCFISCNYRPSVTGDKLLHLYDKTILVRSRQPFTGDLVSDTSKFSYENGVLKGDWFVKGPRGEIIQEGTYIDCDRFMLNFIKNAIGSDVCTLTLWREGDHTVASLNITGNAYNELSDANFAFIYSKYLKKYKRESTVITVYNGTYSAILAQRVYP